MKAEDMRQVVEFQIKYYEKEAVKRSKAGAEGLSRHAARIEEVLADERYEDEESRINRVVEEMRNAISVAMQELQWIEQMAESMKVNAAFLRGMDFESES